LKDTESGAGAPKTYSRDGSDAKTVAGVITNLQKKYTKKGDLMGLFVLEDLESSIEVTVFSRTMQECGHLLVPDAIVAVKGRLDLRDDIPKLLAMGIERLEIDVENGGPPLRIQVAEGVHPRRVEELKELLRANPGATEVFVHVIDAAGRPHFVRLPQQYRVEPSARLIAELRVLLGANAIVS
jgi:DNA polymerase III subunit alpha